MLYCLVALKFLPDWFVTNKVLEKFHDALFACDDILLSKVTCFANKGRVLVVDLDKINLDDDKNFDEDDSETFFFGQNFGLA